MDPILHTPCDGVSFLTITDDRFTTSRITVNMYLPLAEDTAGVNAVLPFVLRRGCKALPTMVEFHRALERLYGADIDADVVSAGEMQILQMSMSCLDDRYALHGESLTADCAGLLLDVLFDPPLDENGLFAAEEVQQECRCTLESIAAEINNKRRYAVAQCKRLMCEGEPYAVSKYGTAESVAAVTPESLTAAWHVLLREAPMRVIYQGPSDGKAVADALAARLGERCVKTLPPVVVREAKAEVARQHEQMDVNQCQLVLGLRTPILGDDARCDAMRLANAVLGGTPQSLLFLHVREEHSLCYYCAARYDRQKGVVVIDSGVEQASLSKAEEEILRQLAALKAGDFSDEMLENTRLAVLDSLKASEDSPSATAAWYGAQGPDAMRTPAAVADGVRRVTREQVIEAANTLTLDCVYTLTPVGEEDAQ